MKRWALIALWGSVAATYAVVLGFEGAAWAAGQAGGAAVDAAGAVAWWCARPAASWFVRTQLFRGGAAAH